MELNFCSLSSGSSGNCYYLGNEFHGILIDAGIPGTSIRRFLEKMNIPIQTIRGVLITHEHTDHIRGLELLTRRHTLPVFTTAKIRTSILQLKKLASSATIIPIQMKQKFCIAEFDIEAFPVCHDASETIGFHIRSGNKSITIATDMGHICEDSAPYLKAANILVIESNYDEQMLINGPYPYFLKKRIHSDHGHLGNHQASAFLAENINNSLTHIFLAHLSKNNNTPQKALDTLYKALSDKGIVLNGQQKVSVLDRDMPGKMIKFCC